MHFIELCTIFIIVTTTFGRNIKAFGNENDHLCEETVTRLTDEGETYNDKVLVCCHGYIGDSSGKCIPFCNRPCIYGFCKAPNVCECIEGYQMRRNECVPTCKKKCMNGYCSKPDTCGCLSGFELDANNLTSCVPVCRPKCINFSKCTKSNKGIQNRCQCTTGYTEDKKTKTCEPQCKHKCQNGICSAPDTCSCFNGFELDTASKNICIPKCEAQCQLHSSCIAPDTCVCNDGYKFNEINKKCEPICMDQVKNSRCVEPPNKWVCVENYQHDYRIDKCVLESCVCNSNGYCLENQNECECYMGFTKNATNAQCESTCQPNCINSHCIAHNVCQCFDGYHETLQNHFCESNDLCNGRLCHNGNCLITGECKCKIGYVKSISLKADFQCDKVQTFIGKVMTVILGVPMFLAACASIALYVINKKRSYNIEEQEMVLIERH